MNNLSLKSAPSNWPVVMFCLALLILLVGCNRPGVMPVSNQPSSSIEPTIQHEPDIPSNSSVFGIEAVRLRKGDRIALIQSIGTAWLRLNGIIWAEIEPLEGTRDWSMLAELEEDILAASGAGINPIVIIRSTPPWAQAIEGSFCGPISEEKLPAFGTFLFDLVKRLSAPPYNVKYWELWNEPDIAPDLVDPTSAFGCWGDAEDEFYGGRYYAKMLQVAYPQILRADPNANILIGGLLLDCDPRNPPEDKTCRSSRYLEGILIAGGGAFFDGISIHAYDYYYSEGKYGNPNWQTDQESSGPTIIGKTQFLREILATYDLPHKYLINTEGAILCVNRDNENQCTSTEFEKTKAAYLTQSFSTALAIDLHANIWYSFTGWRNSGLVDKDLTPRLAYSAFQFAAQELSGSQFVQSVTLYPGVSGHGFQRKSTAIWVLWGTDGLDHTVELPVLPTGIFNLYGEPMPITKQPEVSYEPIFVIWDDS